MGDFFDLIEELLGQRRRSKAQLASFVGVTPQAIYGWRAVLPEEPNLIKVVQFFESQPGPSVGDLIITTYSDEKGWKRPDLYLRQLRDAASDVAAGSSRDMPPAHEGSPDDSKSTPPSGGSGRRRGGRKSASQPGGLEGEHITTHNLPPPSWEFFFGRESDMRAAIDTLRPYPHSQYPILAIDGVGGVGKTALALAVAHFHASGYVPTTVNPDLFVGVAPGEQFDAVVWVSAKRTSLEPSGIVERHPPLRNLSDLYAELATTLDRPEILTSSEEQQQMLVRSALSSRRVLLVIDNLETVDDPRILRFIRDLPAPTKAIITTRYRIDGAVSLRLEGLDPEHAVSLVDAETGRRGLTIEESDRLIIAKETGGIPLAIIWTIGQVAAGRDLSHVLMRLKSAKGDYARFCFAESLQFLEDQHEAGAVHALTALSLFAGGATREGIGFVSGLQDLAYERDTALQRLTDLSLLNFRENRFFLLPLTKEYASAEMKRDLEFESFALSRWYEWHLRITGRAGRGGSDLDSSVLLELEPEHENIVWAVDQAWRKEATLSTFVRLVRNIEFYWLETARWQEFEQYVDKGRQLAPEPIDRVHFAGRLAWMYVLRGDVVRAKDSIDEARRLLDRFPSDYELMRIEDFEGQLEFEKGAWKEAERHFKRSLEVAARLNDRRGLFACNKYLGDVYCELQKLDRARSQLEKAEGYVGEPGEGQWIRGRAFVSHLRGLILRAEGDLLGAEQAFAECIDYLGFHTDVRLMLRARQDLALSRLRGTNSETAVAPLRENLAAFRRLGMQHKVDETQKLLSELEATPQ